jgi:hypothetical protein
MTSRTSDSSKRGITLREVVARLGPLQMPGDGFADDLEAIQESQSEAKSHSAIWSHSRGYGVSSGGMEDRPVLHDVDDELIP